MSEVFASIGQYYDKLLDAYGDDPRSCDYGNSVSQQLKFRAMTEVAPMRDKKILDVGCGLGDLADFISSDGIAIEYTGYDISPQMIQAARQKHPHLHLEQRNILTNPPEEKFDLVLASGIFYLLGEDAPRLTRELIKAMFDACDEAAAFSTLSAWAPDQTPGEYYADPLELMAYCRTLTPWLTLRHDYHHRDFTIYMYREKQ